VDRGSEWWRWTKVSVLHAEGPWCAGAVYSYARRYYPPDSPFYERCVGLSWCSTCRTYTGAMVAVPGRLALVDVLAGLSPRERERVSRSELRLLDHLDRLVRRGDWPPRQP
jgi:hypothetical protein